MLTFNQFISEARIKFLHQRKLPGGRVITAHQYGRREGPEHAGAVDTDFYPTAGGKKMLRVTSFPGVVNLSKKARLTPHLASAARAVRRALQVHKIDPKDPNLVIDYGMDVRDTGGKVGKGLPKGLSRVFGKFGLPIPQDRGTHEDLSSLGFD